MATVHAWNIRKTPERETVIEGLRERLKASGRSVETIHGSVTTAAIFDEALKALDKELTKESKK